MRLRLIVLSLLTTLSLVGAGTLVTAPAASARLSAKAAELALLERINDVRAANGLSPLRMRKDLRQHARAHSGSMSRQRSLFHTASFSVICCWSSISENVAYAHTVRRVHRALLTSAPHRANILDPGKRAIGVGVARAGGQLWVTQVFRQPR